MLRTVGEREILWLRRFGKKRYPHNPLYRELYGRHKVDPQAQVSYLLDYLKLVPYLVPKEEQLDVPTIRHRDLSPSNIFISESGEITGLIDWQHTSILPLSLQAKIPEHFQNWGDEDSENFRPPKLAENLAFMTSVDREAELRRYQRRQAHYFYLAFTVQLNKAHFDAMGRRSLILRNQLYDIAGRPWEGDNTSLQAQLIKTMAQWSHIAASSDDEPPIVYPPAEVKECLERNAQQNEIDEDMQ